MAWRSSEINGFCPIPFLAIDHCAGLDIVNAFERIAFRMNCIARLKGCRPQVECRVHVSAGSRLPILPEARVRELRALRETGSAPGGGELPKSPLHSGSEPVHYVGRRDGRLGFFLGASIVFRQVQAPHRHA